MKNAKPKNGNNDGVILTESNEHMLFDEISAMIEENCRRIYTLASGSTVLLFWRIGQSINRDILDNKRADYGKKIGAVTK